ncbi:MAG TPA: hypothetical protein VFF73_28040 [Planctomycetota bacterium]|nr:hypothetical protein [Planctomycetota bacterium]
MTSPVALVVGEGKRTARGYGNTLLAFAEEFDPGPGPRPLGPGKVELEVVSALALLEASADASLRYDRVAIIPATEDEDLAAKLVVRAWRLLRPGGALVALVPRGCAPRKKALLASFERVLDEGDGRSLPMKVTVPDLALAVLRLVKPA